MGELSKNLLPAEPLIALCLVLSSKPNCAQNLWFPSGPLQWKRLPKSSQETSNCRSHSTWSLRSNQNSAFLRIHSFIENLQFPKSINLRSRWILTPRKQHSKGISSLNANQDAKGTPLGGSCLQIAILQSLQLRSSGKVFSPIKKVLWSLQICRNYDQKQACKHGLHRWFPLPSLSYCKPREGA